MTKRTVALCCLSWTLWLTGCADTTIREYEPRSAPPVTSERTEQKRVPQARTRTRTPAEAGEQPAETTSRPSSAVSPTAGPAVLALLDQAKSQATAGDGNAAAATLERAIAIEPRNPWLWHRLAVLRLQLGQHQQAIELAGKSNALANDHRRLLGGNWKVIAQARHALGDEPGAEQAQAQSDSYFGHSNAE